jgi:hypothetical protein
MSQDDAPLALPVNVRVNDSAILRRKRNQFLHSGRRS